MESGTEQSFARGMLEQAIAISTDSSATGGGNAATTVAWSSALAVKRVQNPWLTLQQLSPRAGVAAASAVQEHLEVPGQRAGFSSPALRAAQSFLQRVWIPAPLQCTQTSTVDANSHPEPIFMFTLFSCMACLQMLAG